MGSFKKVTLAVGVLTVLSCLTESATYGYGSVEDMRKYSSYNDDKSLYRGNNVYRNFNRLPNLPQPSVYYDPRGLNANPDEMLTGRMNLLETTPPKRSALVLDRVLVALHRALGDKDYYIKPYANQNTLSEVKAERRGQEKGKVYWRCYFNAVTCFK